MANLFTNGTEASLLHLIFCDAFAEEACMVHGFTLQVQVARATRLL